MKSSSFTSWISLLCGGDADDTLKLSAGTDGGSHHPPPWCADLNARQFVWAGAGAAVVTDRQESPSACSLSTCTAWPRQPGLALSRARLPAMLWTAVRGPIPPPCSSLRPARRGRNCKSPRAPSCKFRARSAPARLDKRAWRPAGTRRKDGSHADDVQRSCMVKYPEQHGKQQQQPFIVKQICVILQQIKTLAKSGSTWKVIYSMFLHLDTNRQPVIKWDVDLLL